MEAPLEGAFERAVRGGRPERRFVYREETASTQDEAWTLAEAGAPDGSVVLAARQTAGRGRRGRAWDSPAGAGLWFSRVVRSGAPAPPLPLLVGATALAVAEGVERICGVRALLRWPNDLLVGSRKLAGILADARDYDPGAPLLILGVGVNLAQGEGEFPAALRDTATSLRRETGATAPPDPAATLAAILDSLDARLAEAADPAHHDHLDRACVARAALVGERITVLDGDRPVEGTLESVSPLRGLVVRTPTGRRTLRPEHARELRSS